MYTGNDTMIFRQSFKDVSIMEERKIMRSSSSTALDYTSLFFLLMSLYASFFMMLYFDRQTVERERASMIEQINGTKSIVQNYFQILAIVCSLIPAFIVTLQELIFFVAAVRLQRKRVVVPVVPTDKDKEDQNIKRDASAIEKLESPNNPTTRVGKRYMGGGDHPTRYRGSTIGRTSEIYRKRRSHLSSGAGNGASSEDSYPSQRGLFTGYSEKSNTPSVIGDQTHLTTETGLISNHRKRTSEVRQKKKYKTVLQSLPTSLRKLFSFVDEERLAQLQKSAFTISEDSWVKVSNYGQIADLGNIDHVVFDKTSTLTENKIEIVYLSSWRLSYQIEFEHMKIILEDFKKNPESHKHEEDTDQKNQHLEDGFYSEKSQEYEKELGEGEYDSKLFEEDSQFEEALAKIKLPIFMPFKVSKEGRNQLTNSKISHHMEESPQLQMTKVQSVAMPLITIAENVSTNEQNLEAAETSQTGNSTRQIGILKTKDSKIEDILKNTQGFKGANIDKLEALMMRSRRSSIQITNIEMEDNNLSEGDQEDNMQIIEKVCTIRSQFAFYYDYYAKNPEIEMLMYVCPLFLYCGMNEMKSKPSPSLSNIAILSFLKTLDISIVSISSPSNSPDGFGYKVKVENANKTVKTFHIYGVNPRSDGKQRTSIVVSLQVGGLEEQYFIYVKGEEAAMKSCLELSPQEQTHFRNLMVTYKDILLNRIIYAFRKLTQEEVQQYVKNYSIVLQSKKYDVSSMERFVIPLETKLKFIGCLGVKTKIRKESEELVKSLKSSGIRVSMLSGDTYENSINVIKSLKLNEMNYNDKTGYFSLDFDNFERGKMDFLAYIEIIYHFIKSKNNEALNYYMQYLMTSKSTINDHTKISIPDLDNSGPDKRVLLKDVDSANLYKRNLVIGGKALNLIQKFPELEKLFKILIIFTNSIVGYDLKAGQKGYLVKLLREQNEVVLAIGDGFNDMGMFNQANLSIQLAQSDVPLYFGDFVVNKLDIVQELIFHSGFKLLKNLRVVMMYAVAIATKFIATNVWIYSSTGFITRYLAPTYMNIIIIFIMFDSAFRATTQTVYYKKFLSQNPVVYQERKVLERKLAFFISLFIGNILFEITFVFIVLKFYFKDLVLSDGRMLDHECQLSFIFFAFFLNTIYFNFDFYRYSNSYKYISLIIYHIILLCIVLYHIFGEFGTPETYVPVGRIFIDKGAICCILWVILVPSAVSWVITSIMMNKLINPVRHFLMNTLKKEKDWDQFTEEDAEGQMLRKAIKLFTGSSKSTVNHLINLVSEIVKPVEGKPIENSVMNLLLINIHQFKTGFNKRKNKIIDLRDRKKFTITSIASHLNYSRFLLTLSTLLFFIELCLKIYLWNKYGKSISSEIVSWSTLYKLIVTFILAVFTMVPKRFSELTFSKILTYGFCITLAIDIVFFVMQTMNIHPSDQTWLFLNLSSRMLSSSVPISFSYAVALIGGFDILRSVRMVYISGPIPIDISNHIYKFLLFMYLLVLMLLKCSLKKKYDKTCKINFLSVNKMKHEIVKSKEKLSMLMPKFVWDKINTEGFQGRIILTIRILCCRRCRRVDDSLLRYFGF